MCLIAFRWLDHPRWQLALAANRDEFHDRPALPAAWWPDLAGIYGGRDVEAGGSWTAMHIGGRLAVVTNYREGVARRGPRSRGELVAGFVAALPDSDEAFARDVREHAQAFAGFNLLVFDLAAEGRQPRARYFTNRADVFGAEVTPGLHGLSNHLLDTPWPKVRRLRDRVGSATTTAEWPEASFFAALADDAPAPDSELPATGVDHERERMLSAARIRGDGYGTRASTVVLVDHDGCVEYVERLWTPDGPEPVRETRMRMRIATSTG